MIQYYQNSHSLPSIIDRIKLLIDSSIKAKEFAAARKSGQLSVAIKNLFTLQQNPWTTSWPQHPKFDNDVAAFKKNIADFHLDGYDGTIGLGDSILAFSAKHLTSLAPSLNFAEPGGANLNMLQMAHALKSDLETKIKVNYIIEGCYWGNAALAHQDISQMKADTRVAFKGIREVFPTAKRIIYTAPLVYDVYATALRLEMGAFIAQLVKEDGNAVIVSLETGFQGWLGIFPKLAMTTEGVHLSNTAFPIFDARLVKAKRALPGTVIT